MLTLHALLAEVSHSTRVAAGALAEGEVSVGLDPVRQGHGVVRGQEALLPEPVVVEGPAVVLALGRALGPALLDVGHGADVGVGEGKVRAGLVDVLAVSRN